MRQVYYDVRHFMEVAEQPIGQAKIKKLGAVASGLLHSAGHSLKRWTDALRSGGDTGDEKLALFRAQLIAEEMTELFDALSRGSEAAAADALADIIYTAIGMALTFGIPLPAVWEEVHRTNMAKFVPCPCVCVGPEDAPPASPDCPQCGGRGLIPLKDAHGKVIKPPGWGPPNIEQAIEVGHLEAIVGRMLDENRIIGALVSLDIWESWGDATEEIRGLLQAWPDANPEERLEIEADLHAACESRPLPGSPPPPPKVDLHDLAVEVRAQRLAAIAPFIRAVDSAGGVERVAPMVDIPVVYLRRILAGSVELHPASLTYATLDDAGFLRPTGVGAAIDAFDSPEKPMGPISGQGPVVTLAVLHSLRESAVGMTRLVDRALNGDPEAWQLCASIGVLGARSIAATDSAALVEEIAEAVRPKPPKPSGSFDEEC